MTDSDIQEADDLMRDPTASWQKRKALVARAVVLYETALARLESAHGSDSVELTPVIRRLACAYREHAGRDTALRTWQRMLDVLSKGHGDTDAALVEPLFQMARLELEAEHHARAKELFERVLRLHELGATVPRTGTYGDPVTNVLSRVGWCAERLGLTAAAIAAYERVLERDKAVQPPKVELADVEKLFPRAFLRYQRREDTPEAIDALLGLAEIRWAEGRHEEAARFAERAFEAWFSTSGIDNWLHVRRLELAALAKQAGVEVLGVGGPPRPGEIERLVDAWKQSQKPPSRE